MSASFTVSTTAHYERLLRQLVRGNTEFLDIHVKAVGILGKDPYNRSRIHNIRKLTNVSADDGEFRLRIGRYRFRYSIYDKEVVLNYCGLRREETY